MESSTIRQTGTDSFDMMFNSIQDRVKLDFFNFAAKYSVQVDSIQDFILKESIFKQNQAQIQDLNLKLEGVTLSHNQFSILDDESFSKSLGLDISGIDDEISKWQQSTGSIPMLSSSSTMVTLPNSLDLRSYHVVRNQGQCGSCYCFSALSAMEARISQFTKDYLDLSRQQCVSCAGKGCAGGVQSSVYSYIKNNNPMSQTYDYPFTDKQDLCRDDLKQMTRFGNIDDYVVMYEPVAGVNPEIIKLELLNGGEIGGAIFANNQIFKSYQSGILSQAACNSLPNNGQNIDHAISICGWGVTEAGIDYWILGNSWGTSWGEGGYCRVEMTKSGTGACGIQKLFVWPIGSKNLKAPKPNLPKPVVAPVIISQITPKQTQIQPAPAQPVKSPTTTPVVPVVIPVAVDVPQIVPKSTPAPVIIPETPAKAPLQPISQPAVTPKVTKPATVTPPVIAPQQLDQEQPVFPPTTFLWKALDRTPKKVEKNSSSSIRR